MTRKRLFGREKRRQEQRLLEQQGAPKERPKTSALGKLERRGMELVLVGRADLAAMDVAARVSRLAPYDEDFSYAEFEEQVRKIVREALAEFAVDQGARP